MALALFVTVAAVYGRLCFSEFSWYDDPATVHHNPSMNPPTLEKVGQYWTSLGQRAPLGLYIPLTYTVWAGIAKLAYVEQADPWAIHLNPWMFHTANVVLHALAAVVVFLILQRLFKSPWPALAGALVFAVHPVQVEAVGWVSGLKDVLSGLLGLVAIWQYVLYAQRTVRWRWHYALATVALIAAMLAKPSSVVAPVFALTIDVLLLRRPLKTVLSSLALWFLLIVPCILWTKSAQPAFDVPVAPPWIRPMIALDCLAFYLGKLVAPIRLTVDYGRSPVLVYAKGWWQLTWIAPLVVAIVLTILARRRPALIAAGILFVAGLVPVLGFAPFMFQRFSGVADHYLYLSMLGVAMLICVIASEFSNRWITCAAVAIIAAFSARTIHQSGFWHDDQALWQHNVVINPTSGLAQLNLGAAYDRAGDLAQAERCYREAIRIDPDDAAAHDNLSVLLARTKRADEAMEHANRAKEIEQRR
jgi:hypothetical protein